MPATRLIARRASLLRGGRADSFCRPPRGRHLVLRRRRGQRGQLDHGSSRRRRRSTTGVGGARPHVRQPRRARLRQGAKARWTCACWFLGIRAGAFGLITGREMARIGPSAFDVAPDGTVAVLDQVNDRLVMYGSGTAPRYVPIAFTGGEGDLALGADGTAYVLDQAPEPIVRSYAPSGAQLVTTSRLGCGHAPGRPVRSPAPRLSGRDVAAGRRAASCCSRASSRPPRGRGSRLRAAPKSSFTHVVRRRFSRSCRAIACYARGA